MSLRDTPEFAFGYMCERIARGVLQSFGLKFFDLALSAHDRAPLLHSAEARWTAPDALAKGKQILCFCIEFKGKSSLNRWHGGSINDVIKFPERDEHGIDERCYEAMLAVQRALGMPVVLVVLSIEEGQLLGQALDLLPEPRYSPNRSYRMVNWDCRDFTPLIQLSPERLQRYFNAVEVNGKWKWLAKPEIATAWLKDPPTDQKLAAIADFIEPDQRQLEVFRQAIFDWTEENWTHVGDAANRVIARLRQK